MPVAQSTTVFYAMTGTATFPIAPMSREARGGIRALRNFLGKDRQFLITA